jgi:uncharacterized protein
MGLFLVHITGYYELYNAHPVPSAVQDTVLALFLGKTYSLLALCFGFSFFVMMDGARRRGQPFAGRFAWRLALLLLIGCLHALIYRGDIIVVLAAVGFLLIPIDLIRSRPVLLGLATLCFAQPIILLRIYAAQQGIAWAVHDPFFYGHSEAMQVSLGDSFLDLIRINMIDGQASKWSFYIETGRLLQILGLYIVGLVLGRSGFFASPERFARARWVALVFAGASIPTLSYLRSFTSGYGRGSLFWTGVLLGGWIDLAGMTITLLLFMLAWEHGLRRLLILLVPVGRMTLTLYIGQSLVFVPVFYGFGLHLHDRITQPQSLWLGIVSFAAQMLFATIWFRHFHFGPLEWLWRAGTRLSLDVPFRKRTEPLKAAAS